MQSFQLKLWSKLNCSAKVWVQKYNFTILFWKKMWIQISVNELINVPINLIKWKWLLTTKMVLNTICMTFMFVWKMVFSPYVYYKVFLRLTTTDRVLWTYIYIYIYIFLGSPSSLLEFLSWFYVFISFKFYIIFI